MVVNLASAARDSWKSFLTTQSFEAFAVDDANCALSQYRLLQSDLVLLHDAPPDLDAVALCRRLKRDPLNHLIPVVLVKHSPSSSDLARAREAGAADYWGSASSLWDALRRVQCLLELKRYIDEQAKSVLLSLVRSMESKQPLRIGHSERVAAYAEQLGEACGLQDQDLRDLRVASSLHDIGKVAIPESILNKPGPLDSQETSIMRQHPVIGENICAPLKSLRHLLPVIRHHHERADGSGYPDGLCGDAIPLKARILQIADIYDALVTDRPYRDALPAEEALGILQKEAASGWLDMSLVQSFWRICHHGAAIPPQRTFTLPARYV